MYFTKEKYPCTWLVKCPAGARRDAEQAGGVQAVLPREGAHLVPHRPEGAGYEPPRKIVRVIVRVIVRGICSGSRKGPPRDGKARLGTDGLCKGTLARCVAPLQAVD